MQPVYDLLALAIFAMMIVLLFRSFRPAKDQTRDLEDWMAEQLDEQADAFERMLQASQDALSKQNYAAIRGVKDAVDGMGAQLTGSQAAQQKNLEGRFQTMEKTLESRLRTMELSNTQRLEEMRRTLTEGMDAVRAENAKKLDEIRHTVDEQLQDTLQKRVSESFKTVSDQLEQVYKGLGEMQSLAADVGGLKQVLSGVKTRGILGEIQLGAILEEILAPDRLQVPRRHLRPFAGGAGFGGRAGRGGGPPRPGTGGPGRGQGHPHQICGAALHHQFRHPVPAL